MKTSLKKLILNLRFLFIINFLLMTNFGCAHKNLSGTQHPEGAVFTVDGKIALTSLISLSDGHIQKLVDDLSLFAKNPENCSSKWPKVRESLAVIAKNNISAVIWFALPDGTYWSVDGGKASGNLADRPYWSKVMKGQTVVGDLVVSKSTGQNVAIVAVPSLRPDKSVGCVLGSSIYLDKLSNQLKSEMGIEKNYIFYAIDSSVKGALNSNTSLIFTHPKEFGEEMRKVFDEMISRSEGVISYHFAGSKRTALYRKSSTVGWWYAFGIVR